MCENKWFNTEQGVRQGLWCPTVCLYVFMDKCIRKTCTIGWEYKCAFLFVKD